MKTQRSESTIPQRAKIPRLRLKKDSRRANDFADLVAKYKSVFSEGSAGNSNI